MLDKFEAYLIARGRAADTIRLRLGTMRSFAVTHDLATARLEDLTAFIKAHPHWSPNSRQVAIAGFRSFYDWAHRSGLTPTNPAAELQRVRVPRKPARIAPDRVLYAALERATPEDKAMLLLGAEGGLRVTEIATLHMDDRNDRWLSITGKGGHTRLVYISPELAELLDRIERFRTHGYYFRMRGNRHVAPSTVWRHIRKLTDYNTHALRHRAGTTAYRRTGNDLRLAQELLGHASPMTTAIYVHIAEDDLMRAARATRLGTAPVRDLPVAA